MPCLLNIFSIKADGGEAYSCPFVSIRGSQSMVGLRFGHFRLVCFFLLLSYMVVRADSVGASLQLEGAMSVFRGTQYLVNEQLPDGSWRHDPAVTSLAACALQNAKVTEPAAAIPLALAFLKQNIRPTDDWRRSIDLRAPLRAKQSDGLRPPAMMDCPPAARLWLLDAILLTQKGNDKIQLQDSFFKGLEPCQSFAVKLATTMDGIDSLSPLRQETRLMNWKTESIETIYWAARALFTWDRTTTPVQDNWQHDILSALLTRQKGDGAWHLPNDSPEATVRQTALAIETIILCLQ